MVTWANAKAKSAIARVLEMVAGVEDHTKAKIAVARLLKLFAPAYVLLS